MLKTANKVIIIIINISLYRTKSKHEKVGVLPIRLVQSNVSSIGPSSERNRRKANARNVKLHYPYWQYTDLFIFRFCIFILCLRSTLRLSYTERVAEFTVTPSVATIGTIVYRDFKTYDAASRKTRPSKQNNYSCNFKRIDNLQFQEYFQKHSRSVNNATLRISRSSGQRELVERYTVP